MLKEYFMEGAQMLHLDDLQAACRCKCCANEADVSKADIQAQQGHLLKAKEAGNIPGELLIILHVMS